MSYSCHGQALLEIKCPHKIRNGLYGWDSDPGFPVSSDECMFEEHLIITSYKMLVTGYEKKYFYIWAKAKTDNFILITVQKD